MPLAAGIQGMGASGAWPWPPPLDSTASTTARVAAGITAAASTAHQNASTAGSDIGAQRRHVVLHHEHGVHHLPHQQVVEMEISLVVVLVFVHILALVFWMWLLYASKEKRRGGKKAEIGAGGDTPKARRSAATSAFTWGEWRTPKEVMASWGKAHEKQRLGKV